METLARGAVVQLDRAGARGTDAERPPVPVPERRRPPRPQTRSERHLSGSEREEISRGIAAGESARQLAKRLGRSPSTVSREIARNGGRDRYRAAPADAAAYARGRRPKQAKLAQRPALRTLVEAKLVLCWSPEQIAGWLRRQFPGDASMQISHEAIYLSLYDPRRRQAIDRSLTQRLRSGRPMRRPKLARQPTGRGIIRGMVSITARPAEVEDRKVPGHWEGDLVMGTGLRQSRRSSSAPAATRPSSRCRTASRPSRSPRTSPGVSSASRPGYDGRSPGTGAGR